MGKRRYPAPQAWVPDPHPEVLPKGALVGIRAKNVTPGVRTPRQALHMAVTGRPGKP